MRKEEILKKSRRENKNQDLYEKQVMAAGGNAGAVAAALATVFFVAQILTGGGMNYGLYAVVFTIPAARFTVKAIKLRRKHEIALAALYWLGVVLFSAAHLYQLITISAIF